MAFGRGLVASQRSSGSSGKTGIRLRHLSFSKKKIIAGVEETTMRALNRFGAFVRRDARKSMRKAKKKTKSEMTEAETIIFDVKMSLFKQGKLPKPKRPLASSKPGEPPRVIKGKIKKLLEFKYSKRNKTVVIGPQISSNATGAPRVLEEGGIIKSRIPSVDGSVVKPRPAMGPAFRKNLPKMAAIWRASVR